MKGDGYPVESHNVTTSDGYVLTMFRIPYSPKLQNQNKSNTVVFLQHGLLGSSDCWILNGADNALAYNLADAGYDVWMGNARGTTYSRRNVKIPSILPTFWDFSWNEIAVIDMPAMIDYALNKTGKKDCHYVGHSQGTTVYFVMLSTLTENNKKIRSAHMLAPVAFMDHMQTPLTVLAPLTANPNVVTALIGSNEFMPTSDLLALLGDVACKDESLVQEMCAMPLFLVAGWDSKYFNYVSYFL